MKLFKLVIIERWKEKNYTKLFFRGDYVTPYFPDDKY